MYSSITLDSKKPPVEYKLSFRGPYDATDISELILYSFIIISGTIGNGLVIRSFIRASNQPGSRFVTVLAAFDFLASIWLPLTAITFIMYDSKHWPFGKIGCLVINVWKTCPFFASSWILVAIALERARYELYYCCNSIIP